MAVTIAAFAAIGPAGKSLSQQFSVPGREGFEANQQIATIYGSGGDVAPLVPVVQLPKGTTVDSPGVRSELAAALAHVSNALPKARIASYASTGDRSFVSADGRTTFALVDIRPDFTLSVIVKSTVLPSWLHDGAAAYMPVCGA